MSKKKVTKASKRRLLLFGTLSVFFIGYLFVTIFHYAYSITNLKKESASLEEELLSLKETEQELKLEIEKLQDPEYIARYARENYLYSKDGEYIIKIEKETEEETSNSTSITDYYPYFIGGGVLVIVLLLFIVRKAKKS